MAYRFKLTETFDHGMRRIGLQQIDRCIAELEELEDANLAVHGTRKGLKRIRALLRLAKPGLETSVYRHENRSFRDIGRILSHARDRHVLELTIQNLEAVAETKTKQSFKAALKQLAAAHGTAPDVIEARPIKRAIAALKSARKRFEQLGLHSKSFEVAFDGLKLGYGQAVKTFETACETGDTEDIHEWRKRVQHHFRHLMLMSESAPLVFDTRIETARALANKLGEDHDLALLQAAVGEDGVLKLSAAHRRVIEEFASARRAALWSEAQAIGQALFSDKPRTFREKVKGHWVAALEGAAKVKPQV